MDEVGNIKERAMVLLKLGYEQALSSTMSVATIDHIGPKLDPPLHRGNWEEQREFRKLAQYLSNKGYVESVADGLLWFRLTTKGFAQVEGEEQHQTRVTSYTQTIGGNAYGTAMGENITMDLSFDMRSVEANLDDAERRAREEAGPGEIEQVEELIAELRDILNSDAPIEPGRLAKFGNTLQKYSYLVSPTLGALLNQAFRGFTGT